MRLRKLSWQRLCKIGKGERKIGKVYTKQLIEGVDIPGIIHNSSYFLSRLAVYENGTVSCWRRCDLKEFEKELCRGWVVPQIP